MKVFKFGGASIKDAAGVQNVERILEPYQHEQLVIVASAMGKTTDALEHVLATFLKGSDITPTVANVRSTHEKIMAELFPPAHPVWGAVDQLIQSLPGQLAQKGSFDFIYDQVVSIGELLSTTVLFHYLQSAAAPVAWLDARQVIRTDATFREGKVRWKDIEKNSAAVLDRFRDATWLITQGFIGRTEKGETTTLGRDGSDFSAAIFASVLQAESVTIWKDVPGVMNADPKRLPAAVVFEELPFREAAEMTYYGANVIHPKTIKPLANRKIPLYVKSFVNPDLPGTRIREGRVDYLPPLTVFKDDQCLVSCKVTDYSFITEEQLGFIFNLLSRLHVKINLMQNSAISFSFCTDFEEQKILPLIEELSQHFEVFYNTPLTLITVKNYDAATQAKYQKIPGLVLEQSSRSTLQVLVKGS
jgi:aspartate kinase